MIEIAWEQEPHAKGGSVIVDTDGVTVTTECHGCNSVPLDDHQKILSLFHALGDWLMAHNRELSDPDGKKDA